LIGLVGLVLCFGLPCHSLAQQCDTGCGDMDCCSSGCGTGCGCGCCNWLVYGDALLLTRDANYGYDGESSMGDGIGIGATNGFQVGAIKKLRNCWDFEAKFQMFEGNWGRSYDIVEQASYNLDYLSSLYSTEFNLIRSNCSWIRPLFGFRFIELDERFSADMTYSERSYTARMLNNNHLYGFQVGADAILIDTCKFSLLTNVKAGIYGNHCQQRTQYIEDSGQGEEIESVGTSTTHTSFQGELSILGKYKINCHWSLRAGYYLYWLEGVSLAPSQIGLMGDGEPNGCDYAISTAGSPFYHGAIVGLEACW
jgi:hypothetical protein